MSISRVLTVCPALSISRSVSTGERRVALTLDVCSGAFDEKLIDFLIRNGFGSTSSQPSAGSPAIAGAS